MISFYTDSKLDSVHVLYNEFKSVIQQQVVIEPLLPIRKIELEDNDDTHVDYIYEQPPQQILDSILPRHVETQLFRAMLESEAAEHAARMTAMDAATRNAREMIDNLTLKMNRLKRMFQKFHLKLLKRTIMMLG